MSPDESRLAAEYSLDIRSLLYSFLVAFGAYLGFCILWTLGWI